MRRFFVAATLLIGLTTAQPLFAQDQTTVPDELLGMVGSWVLAQEDDTLPTCALTFTDQQAIGGWAIDVPASCPVPYPAADKLTAWNVDEGDGSVILLDAERHVTLRLYEDEDGLYVSGPDQTPKLYLLPPSSDSGGETDSD